MKAFSPAAERNRGPITEVLRAWLPERGKVLEIASGSGQHAVHFAQAFPGLTWQPSDADPSSLVSIRAWREEADLPNLLPPVELEVSQAEWGVREISAVVCLNMIHISPWKSAEALIRGAASRLPPGGILYLYGPYLVEGIPTAPSNLEFDAWLKSRNPSWGVRDLAEVRKLAEAEGLVWRELVPMPANNYSVIFSR